MRGWMVWLVLAGCAVDEGATPGATEGVGALMAPAASPGALTGVVAETMNAGGYTYARLTTGAGEVWVAGPETPMAVGERVSASGATAMHGFTSRTLGRTFDEIYFVGAWGGSAPPTTPPAATWDLPKPAPAAPAAPVAVVEGTKSVSEVLASGAALAGQQVAVQGVVVKVNTGILGRNWIHLRPSATAAEDLLVTTADVATVGDSVVATGIVATDKDFGAGYTYALLVEDATVRGVR